MNKHVLPEIGGVLVQKLDTTRLDRLYRELGEKSDKRKKPLSPSTIRFIAAVVSASLRYARKKRLVVRNVARDADVPRAQRPTVSVWSDRELRRFLDSVQDHRLYGLWRLLALSGMRPGEALGLTWLALDLKAGTAKITQQLVPVGKQLVLSPPKTESGIRTIPLDEGTIGALKEHRERQQLERMMFGDSYSDGDLVFCEPDGRPLNPRGVSQLFQRLRGKTGLPHVRLHDLRHGMAVMALADNVNSELVRRRLGHSRVATTIDLYQRHRIEDVEKAVADGLAARVDGPR